MSYGRAAWSAGAVGALLGVGCMAISVTVLGAYGVALFFAAPIVCGVVSAVLFVSLHGPSRSGPYAAALCAMALAGAVLVAFAVEGFFCLLMAAPLVLLGVLSAPSSGRLSAWRAILDGPRGRKRTVGGALAMLPLSLLADQAGSAPAWRRLRSRRRSSLRPLPSWSGGASSPFPASSRRASGSSGPVSAAPLEAILSEERWAPSASAASRRGTCGSRSRSGIRRGRSPTPWRRSPIPCGR